MTVITADDIRRSGARSLPDALRLAPGVDIAELSFAQYAVSPRGGHALSGNRLLVLVDGRQLFDSYFGGTMWASWPLALTDIERIEVIRGPGGLSWGANAVDGVINIITKDPADQPGITYRALGGSRGWWHNYLGATVKEDQLRVRISGEYEASDGFAEGGSFLGNLHDDQKRGRVSLYGIYEVDNDDTFTFSFGNALMDGGFSPTPLGTIFDGHRSPGTQANYLLGKWSHQVAEDNEFEITTFFNDFQLSTGLHAIDYRYQQYALQFTHTFKPAPQHTITWGLDTRFDRVDASGCDPHGLTEPYVHSGMVGLYLQDTWRFAPRWQLDVGGRIDYDFYGGFEPSTRAALAYKLDSQSTLYGAVSRSFAMPPGAARLLDTPLLGGLFHTTADHDVQAQSVIAYELGYRTRLWDKLEMNVATYWHEFDNLAAMPFKLGPPGLLQGQFSTSGPASAYGVEWEARYDLTPQLDLLAHYTYQQLDWRADAALHLSDQISPPTHKAMLGTRYDPLPNLHLDTHLYYVDSVRTPNPTLPFLTRHVPAYWRLDLRAEYTFWDDQASLSVGVKNLLDDHHPEGTSLFLESAEVPRMIYAEFRIAF